MLGYDILRGISKGPIKIWYLDNFDGFQSSQI